MAGMPVLQGLDHLRTLPVEVQRPVVMSVGLLHPTQSVKHGPDAHRVSDGPGRREQLGIDDAGGIVHVFFLVQLGHQHPPAERLFVGQAQAPADVVFGGIETVEKQVSLSGGTAGRGEQRRRLRLARFAQIENGPQIVNRRIALFLRHIRIGQTGEYAGFVLPAACRPAIFERPQVVPHRLPVLELGMVDVAQIGLHQRSEIGVARGGRIVLGFEQRGHARIGVLPSVFEQTAQVETGFRPVHAVVRPAIVARRLADQRIGQG